MKARKNRTRVITGATTAMLGLALISLASCSSGDSSSGQVSSGGSAALQGPLVFVNNTGDKTLSTVALRGDSGNALLNTLGPGVFGNVALGDMNFSEGEWVFMNLGAGNAVAAIDPLTNATPVHEANLTAGTRPVHIYRDPTDGEVMWVMNDGDNTGGTLTPGDDLINCAPAVPVPGQNYGGSVTILHNSHLGPGATPPTVERTVCVLADGHRVTAFSRPIATNATIPRRAFVSSSTAGEIAVIDNTPILGGDPDWHLINRIDLCDQDRENALPATFTPATCNPESDTVQAPFTTNNSNPHGIRFSQLTGRIYSIQENYRTIVEIDPNPVVPGQWITRTFDLNATPYRGYGISPEGRFLLLHGTTTDAPAGPRFGVIDLGVNGQITDFTNLNPALAGTSTLGGASGRASFKFSPDGRRFYFLTGNPSTGATLRNRLFAFDASALTATPPALTLLPGGEIVLPDTGAHGMDLLVLPPNGAPAGTPGEARYLVVSNKSFFGSLSIISATDNQLKQTVTVGSLPEGVMVYYPGAAASGNQATF